MPGHCPRVTGMRLLLRSSLPPRGWCAVHFLIPLPTFSEEENFFECSLRWDATLTVSGRLLFRPIGKHYRHESWQLSEDHPTHHMPNDHAFDKSGHDSTNNPNNAHFKPTYLLVIRSVVVAY